jgi:hypothetical protein
LDERELEQVDFDLLLSDDDLTRRRLDHPSLLFG